MNKNQKLKIAVTLLKEVTTTPQTLFKIVLEAERIKLTPLEGTFYHLHDTSSICNTLGLLSYVTIEEGKLTVIIF